MKIMGSVAFQYFKEVFYGLRYDLFRSEAEIISLFTVFLFCFCCAQLIKTIYKPIPIFASDRDFSRRAHRVEKAYKVFSWGLMSFVFLLGLVISFYHIFTEI